MGIALFHLLPESAESFEEFYKHNDPDSKWNRLPLAFFIAFGAYSLILLIEKVAFDSHSLTDHDHGGHKHENNKDHDEIAEPLLNNNESKKKELNRENEIHLNAETPNDEETARLNKKGYEELGSIEEDSQDDIDNTEDTIKNVVSTKGKFASYLQARNLCN
jgi:hypothetical protein